LGGNGAPSVMGVEGAESLTARLVRLRFNDDLAPLAGFSLGVSGAAGAASSRARALVDRRGSDISWAGGVVSVTSSSRLSGELRPTVDLSDATSDTAAR
jgi:hypothetical protein